MQTPGLWLFGHPVVCFMFPLCSELACSWLGSDSGRKLWRSQILKNDLKNARSNLEWLEGSCRKWEETEQWEDLFLQVLCPYRGRFVEQESYCLRTQQRHHVHFKVYFGWALAWPCVPLGVLLENIDRISFTQKEFSQAVYSKTCRSIQSAASGGDGQVFFRKHSRSKLGGHTLGDAILPRQGNQAKRVLLEFWTGKRPLNSIWVWMRTSCRPCNQFRSRGLF